MYVMNVKIIQHLLLGNLMRRIIKEENKEILVKMNDFRKSLDYYSNKIDEFTTTQIKQITEDNPHLQKKHTELAKNVKNCKRKIIRLRLRWKKIDSIIEIVIY